MRANEHAVHADETYIADQAPIGLYPSAYYPHNYHFMWFAASLAGMSAKAMQAAELVAPKVPVEVAKEIYWVQTVTVLPLPPPEPVAHQRARRPPRSAARRLTSPARSGGCR